VSLSFAHGACARASSASRLHSRPLNVASIALPHADAALASKGPGGGAESYAGGDRSVAQTRARAKKYVRATRENS
jgi:hypothetical protein